MSINFVEEIQEIRASAMEMMHRKETERIGSPSIGDVVRQGDLYVECLDEAYRGKTVTTERKLAPGTTQGSQHIVHGDVTIWKENPVNEPEVLLGPSFRCDSDVEIEHPEHGNKILPAGTVWAVVYQRVYAEEVRRVQD